jgi:hypothetical protein
MDGVMQDLDKQNTQWKKNMYFTVEFAGQKLSNYYAEVTPMTDMLLISAPIFDSLQKLRSFYNWDKAKKLIPKNATFYTIQYQ